MIVKKLKPPDHPLKDCIAGAQRVIDAGGVIFQKWWCRGCGRRCTANAPNQITQYCRCEHCGKITDVSEHGCNYSAILSFGRRPAGA